MYRRRPYIRRKNPVGEEYEIKTEPLSMEQKIENKKKFWKWLGIEGTPTKEIIESGSMEEMETYLTMRKVCPY